MCWDILGIESLWMDITVPSDASNCIALELDHPSRYMESTIPDRTRRFSRSPWTVE